MDRLFFVDEFLVRHLSRSLGVNRFSVCSHPPTRRVDRQGRRRRYRRSVSCLDEELLSKFRDRRRRDALGKYFLNNLRDIIDAQAAFARRDIRILTAQLYLQHSRVPFVLVSLTQFSITFYESLIVVRISNLVQCAADDGLRLPALGGR